jgi:hypothetical protein
MAFWVGFRELALAKSDKMRHDWIAASVMQLQPPGSD